MESKPLPSYDNAQDEECEEYSRRDRPPQFGESRRGKLALSLLNHEFAAPADTRALQDILGNKDGRHTTERILHFQGAIAPNNVLFAC